MGDQTRCDECRYWELVHGKSDVGICETPCAAASPTRRRSSAVAKDKIHGLVWRALVYCIGAMTTLTDNLIVVAYGRFLERERISFETIKDANLLPFEKEQILDAVLVEIVRADDLEIISALEFSAIMLAQFQEGVGSEPLYATGVDMAAAKIETKDQMVELARRVANDSNRQRYADSAAKIEEEIHLIRAKLSVARELSGKMTRDKKRQVFGI